MKRILTHVVCSLTILAAMAVGALAADPGAQLPFASSAHQVSDQVPGFMLIYNIYTSSASNPAQQNTRISLTNTNDQFPVSVHLFFVDGGSCGISDRYVCLTPNQTTTFLASEQDPGTTGYIVALATSSSGFPIPFDFLIGDAFVKFENGFFGNLGAEAIPSGLVSLVGSSLDESQALLVVTGLPRVLAVDNIGSRADGNETLLVVNGVGGDFRITPFPVGRLFGLLYNDQEEPHSWNSSGLCQLVTQLNNNFPRTTPRFDVVIPAGQTGWMRFWSTTTVNNTGVFGGSADALALLGAVFRRNPNAATSSGAFQGAHNLHKLRVNSYRENFFGDEAASAPVWNSIRGTQRTGEQIQFTNITPFIFPVFPPNCGFFDRREM